MFLLTNVKIKDRSLAQFYQNQKKTQTQISSSLAVSFWDHSLIQFEFFWSFLLLLLVP